MNLTDETVKKVRGIILFAVIVAAAAIHYEKCLAVLLRIFDMISPFLLGGAIAFVLNVPMRRIESLIKGKREQKKWHRPLSLVLTIVLVGGVLLLVMFVVIPEVVKTTMTLSESIPAFVEITLTQAVTLFSQYPEIVRYIEEIEIDWAALFQEIIFFFKNGAGSVLNSTVSAALSIANGFADFGIGFIFSIYLLLQKETLVRQGKKLVRAFLQEKKAERLIEIVVRAEKIFSSFLAGQCVEAVILGTLFFITMSVLQMPYALLIGVLIAFTALIPVFGAFIGCAVGIFLMLMVNPVSALEFLAVFLILQQIEGNLIYPHVVGNSVGLPSIWVLAAVTIGGSLMGVVGMLIFIPLCSLLYSLLRDEVNRRTLAKKNKKGKE